MKRCLLLLLAAGVGCSAETTTSTVVTERTPAASPSGEAVATESGAISESPVFVIDVRSESEWEAGHVEQAVHIPHTEIADRISEVTNDKNAKIVLYCAVGGRAGKAKEKLEELGYTNVYNAGGFDDVKDRY